MTPKHRKITEYLIRTSMELKYKLPRYDGDDDKFIREWIGVLSILNEQQLCIFLKITTGVDYMDKLKSKNVQAKISELMEKAKGVLDEVFKIAIKDGVYSLKSQDFTAIYPTKEDDSSVLTADDEPARGRKVKVKVGKKPAGKRKKVVAVMVDKKSAVKKTVVKNAPKFKKHSKRSGKTSRVSMSANEIRKLLGG